MSRPAGIFRIDLPDGSVFGDNRQNRLSAFSKRSQGIHKFINSLKDQMKANIFREYDIRGIVGEELTEETVSVISRAIGTFFRRNGAARIAIGRDMRRSSDLFADLLAGGLNDAGCDVLDIGMVPTPVLYYAAHTKSVDGGVMITGSHNPADHNGFKICLGTNAIYGRQIGEIGDIAASGDFISGSGTRTQIDILGEYCEEIAARLSLGGRKIKAVVDAGNGMGGVTALPIYERLGVEVIPLFPEPDGHFPNHHPDPTVPENLQPLASAVEDNNADLGIAFDGDGDRIGVVDETGRTIWGDELMIVLARAVLSERPGATIIGEVKCSQNLFDDIRRHGGKALMWKAGHSLIKAKMKETGAALAGEMSGHIFFADRFYGFDDAAYAGGRILEILSKTDKPFSALFADIPQTFSTPEIRIACRDDKKFEIVNRIAEFYKSNYEVITIDGARINFPNGWGLVRPSNTQAILVLRFEADSPEHLSEIQRNVEAKVSEMISAARAA